MTCKRRHSRSPLVGPNTRLHLMHSCKQLVMLWALPASSSTHSAKMFSPADAPTSSHSLELNPPSVRVSHFRYMHRYPSHQARRIVNFQLQVAFALQIQTRGILLVPFQTSGRTRTRFAAAVACAGAFAGRSMVARLKTALACMP